MKLLALLIARRPAARVLCDPNMPPRWVARGHTVIAEPVPAGEGEFPIRVRSSAEPVKRKDWLEDLDASVLNIPRFLR